MSTVTFKGGPYEGRVLPRDLVPWSVFYPRFKDDAERQEWDCPQALLLSDPGRGALKLEDMEPPFYAQTSGFVYVWKKA